MILSQLPPGFLWIMAVIYGMCLGSFTTCVIYRIPRGLSIWRQSKQGGEYRSFCPSCGHVLKAVDLVPLVSWIVQGGRCRYCRAPIGWVYPLVEFLVLGLVLGLFWVFGFSLYTLFCSFLIPLGAGLGAFLRQRIRS